MSRRDIFSGDWRRCLSLVAVLTAGACGGSGGAGSAPVPSGNLNFVSCTVPRGAGVMRRFNQLEHEQRKCAAAVVEWTDSCRAALWDSHGNAARRFRRRSSC